MIYFLRLLVGSGREKPDVVNTFIAIIGSVIEYSCEVWHTGMTKEHRHDIKHVHKRGTYMLYPYLSFLI